MERESTAVGARANPDAARPTDCRPLAPRLAQPELTDTQGLQDARPELPEMGLALTWEERWHGCILTNTLVSPVTAA